MMDKAIGPLISEQFDQLGLSLIGNWLVVNNFPQLSHSHKEEKDSKQITGDASHIACWAVSREVPGNEAEMRFHGDIERVGGGGGRCCAPGHS